MRTYQWLLRLVLLTPAGMWCGQGRALPPRFDDGVLLKCLFAWDRTKNRSELERFRDRWYVAIKRGGNM